MRILIVSDAWHPQVNGVVRTLQKLSQGLQERGFEVHVLSPHAFRTIPCPTYPEIRLALTNKRTIAKIIDQFHPCAIHIATEGPLGIAARKYCLKRNYPFTTAYHTRFPEYVNARFKLPLPWLYAWMRHFHRPSSAVMVATQTIEDDLKAWGFANIKRWSRGVDTALFRPRPETRDFLNLPRPISMYVGRIAVEKSIDEFLKLDLPGSKVVVGDGPQLAELKTKYPDVHYAGMREGEDLAQHFAAADVFVFPSRTDTFGLVLVEAMASGVPVAAYPVPGPLDVVGDTKAGVLDEDLKTAVLKALELNPDDARTHAQTFSWDACLQQFLDNLDMFREPDGAIMPKLNGEDVEDGEQFVHNPAPGE